MNSFFDLEIKKHGNTLFPFASYHLDYDKNTVILDCHWHSEIEFLMVSEGSGQFRIGEDSFTINRGECLIIPGGCLHSGITSPESNCSFDAVVFSPELILSKNEDKIQTDCINTVLSGLKQIVPALKREDPLYREMSHQISTLLNTDRHKRAGYELKIKIILLEVFLVLYNYLLENKDWKSEGQSEGNPVREESIKEALSFIHLNYKKSFTLHDLAKSANLSDAHFTRIFRKTVLMTPFEYLHYYRINRSAELLKATDYSLARISRETGYESVNYFIRRFRRVMNCTPMQFRKSSQTGSFYGTP